MKKDMLHRVNAVAAEFRKVANNQMAETTKRTIRENVAISLQLTKVTEQSLQLIQENDRLKAAHAEATKQLQLLEQNEKKMVKNSLGHQKAGALISRGRQRRPPGPSGPARWPRVCLSGVRLTTGPLTSVGSYKQTYYCIKGSPQLTTGH